MESATGSLATKVVNDENENPSSSSSVRKPQSQRKGKRNIMLEKFKHFDPERPIIPYEYEPRYFFFYGTLMDPQRLQEVLRLSAPPILKPAKVRSYKVMLWEQYPALVFAHESDYVDGVAFWVGTEEHQRMLEHYETDVYGVTGIRIIIDGEVKIGRVFMWNKDEAELTEGTWSLEEWKNGVEEEMASHFRPVKD